MLKTIDLMDKVLIHGVEQIAMPPVEDERGHFKNILKTKDGKSKNAWNGRPIAQVNLSFNLNPSTIRGLHYQTKPKQDAKLVSCISGSVWDVVVDLRPASPTYLRWAAFTLSGTNGDAVLIPEGCAHGFQVLEPRTQLIYVHSCDWSPAHEAGIRYDDPYLNIQWPLLPDTISERDLNLPYLVHAYM